MSFHIDSAAEKSTGVRLGPAPSMLYGAAYAEDVAAILTARRCSLMLCRNVNVSVRVCGVEDGIEDPFHHFARTWLPSLGS